MVLEVARITVRAGSDHDFEVAFRQAGEILAKQSGYREHALRRGIEDTSCYMLSVRWERLEDHTERFVGSEAFKRFGGLIGPYFAGPPAVEHFQDS